MSDNAEMVQIPGGTFTMGSPRGEMGLFRKPLRNEQQHQVTVSPFYMAKYLVTQTEYEKIMKTNPSKHKYDGEHRPVDNLNWYEAIEYCNALSLKEGLTPAYTIDKTRPDPNNRDGHKKDKLKWLVTWDRTANGYRLPTEAEWEYACRAGTTTAYNTGRKISRDTGWYAKDSNSNTHPVGLLSANAWGLYDMHGNVDEWCWDWCADYPTEAQTDPAGPSSGSYRVLRGGRYFSNATDLRSASRHSASPASNEIYYGIRLVRN